MINNFFQNSCPNLTTNIIGNSKKIFTASCLIVIKTAKAVYYATIHFFSTTIKSIIAPSKTPERAPPAAPPLSQPSEGNEPIRLTLNEVDGIRAHLKITRTTLGEIAAQVSSSISFDDD